MATIKQIGGSWSLDLDYNDDFSIVVNGEEIHREKLETDVTISFYMKRRNKSLNNWNN